LREFQRFNPDPDLLALLAAEDLAFAYGEAATPGLPKTPSLVSRRPGLEAAPLSGVWQFTSTSGKVILLHKNTEAFLARMAGFNAFQNLPSDVRVTLEPPGRDKEGVFVS